MKLIGTTTLRYATLALCLAAGAGSAFAAAPAQVADTAKGKTLVDAAGMTLYTFVKDSDGKSACNGPCANNWPPLKADAAAKADGGYAVITRDDGIRQWSYKGRPLYTWVNDKKPGDTTGDGFLNGAWHVAQP